MVPPAEEKDLRRTLWRLQSWQRIHAEAAFEEERLVDPVNVVLGGHALLSSQSQWCLFGARIAPKCSKWLPLAEVMSDAASAVAPPRLVATNAGLVALDGNHRLALARLLGLSAIRCRVFRPIVEPGAWFDPLRELFEGWAPAINRSRSLRANLGRSEGDVRRLWERLSVRLCAGVRAPDLPSVIEVCVRKAAEALCLRTHDEPGEMDEVDIAVSNALAAFGLERLVHSSPSVAATGPAPTSRWAALARLDGEVLAALGATSDWVRRAPEAPGERLGTISAASTLRFHPTGFPVARREHCGSCISFVAVGGGIGLCKTSIDQDATGIWVRTNWPPAFSGSARNVRTTLPRRCILLCLPRSSRE